MSAPPPQVRRRDRVMSDENTLAALRAGYCSRLATIGADGYPYCVPLLYVVMDDLIYVHNTVARGHLRMNVDHDARVCFETDEAGAVFPYGRFECDSTLAYKSVVVFGTIRVIEDRATKQRFCEALMEKYGNEKWERPKGLFPRIDQITVYAITPERMTGKEIALPDPRSSGPQLTERNRRIRAFSRD